MKGNYTNPPAWSWLIPLMTGFNYIPIGIGIDFPNGSDGGGFIFKNILVNATTATFDARNAKQNYTWRALMHESTAASLRRIVPVIKPIPCCEGMDSTSTG